MADGMLHPEFQAELTKLVNKHSLDNACETPDFILAGMLTEHLEAYRKGIRANIQWHLPKGIGTAGGR